MRRLPNLLLTLVVVLTLSSQTLAQGTIKFTNNPSWDGTDIKADGTYTVDTGWILVNVTMYAVGNPNGGRGGQNVCAATKGNWSGKVLDPPNADYKVYARLMIRQKCTSNDRYFDTPLLDLKTR